MTNAAVTAVVLARSRGPFPEEMPTAAAAAMIPIAGRTQIERVLDLLVDVGVTQVSVLVQDDRKVRLHERLNALLGSGQRFGLKLDMRPVGAEFELSAAQVSLLGITPFPRYAAAVESIPLGDLAAPATGSVVLVDERDRMHLGWVVMAPDAAQHPEATSIRTVPSAMSLRTLPGVVESLHTTLTAAHASLIVAGTEIAPGVFVAGRTHIDPSARFVPPVFVGERCRIGAGSVIGPDVSVEADSSVGRQCSIEGSIVFPRAVIGDMLEVKDLIVVGDILVKTHTSVTYQVSDGGLVRPR